MRCRVIYIGHILWECALASAGEELRQKRKRKAEMVKVIDEGPDPSVVKRKVCGNCGAKLEYVPADVRKYEGTDYSGGPDGCEWIVCPKCGKDVTLKSW